MVEIPFLIVATLCLQIYILAVIFCLTWRILTPKLSQTPISFNCQDYIPKRGLFVIYIAFFEMVFVLFVHVELSRHALVIAHPVTEKRCLEFCDYLGMNFVLCGVFFCLLLSVARCILQGCVLGSLSKPDVVSMTNISLLSLTYLVTLLCVRLFFHLNQEPDPNQPTEMICFQKVNWPTAVVRSSPVKLYLFTVTFITISFLCDFALSSKEQGQEVPSYGYLWSAFTRHKKNSSSQSDTCPKHTDVHGRQQTHLKITLINDNEATSPSLPSDTKMRIIQASIMSATQDASSAVEVEQSNAKSEKSWGMYFPKDLVKIQAAQSASGSLWEFLSGSVRMHMALVVYFAVLLGCYLCIEYLLLYSFLEDFTPVVFVSVVIVSSGLRTVQIAYARNINDDEKPEDDVAA